MFSLCKTDKTFATKILDTVNVKTAKSSDNNNLTGKLNWNLKFFQYLML